MTELEQFGRKLDRAFAQYFVTSKRAPSHLFCGAAEIELFRKLSVAELSPGIRPYKAKLNSDRMLYRGLKITEVVEASFLHVTHVPQRTQRPFAANNVARSSTMSTQTSWTWKFCCCGIPILPPARPT